MALCPVANSIGCKQCGIVKVCLLRSVVGNYAEQEKVDPKAETINVEDEKQE